jgi:hypothetical protein
MPSVTLHVGTFASVYIGQYMASGVPLTELTSLTTGEERVVFSQPEAFSYWTGNSLQSGPASIRVDLTFLSDDPNIVRLAEGNWLTAPNPDDPSSYAQYTLLLVHPDDTSDASFLIPQCYTLKNLNLNYSKTAPTVLPLTFVYQSVSRYKQIYYKDTVDNLVIELANLGIPSPF